MNADTNQIDPIGRIADSFVDRYRKGERPSVQEYVREHPELEDEIREVIPALVMMEEAKSGKPEDIATVTDAARTRNHKMPQALGDFEILREIGRGGMGVVYEAVQKSLGRRVALKVLPAHATSNDKTVKRFCREGQAAGRLHHTNIVPVYGVGEDCGIHYIAMQRIEGHGLDRVLSQLTQIQRGDDAVAVQETQDHHESVTATDMARSLLGQEASRTPRSGPSDTSGATSPLPAEPLSTKDRKDRRHDQFDPAYWRKVALIGVQAARALEYAHAQGTVHRDIKPSNLLLDVQGSVWITDFGLAKADDQDDLTGPGEVLGTLRYMAPEALEGRLDGRSDVCSLGLTLYELACLTPARDAALRSDLLQQVRGGKVPRLRSRTPQIPRDLETILHKAIEPEPQKRYASAAAFADDLERYLDDRPIHARRVTFPERFWRACRRNPSVSIPASIAALVVVLTLAIAFSLVDAERKQAILEAKEKSQLAADNARLAANERNSGQQARKALAAEAEQRKLAETARDAADRSARQSKVVTDFLINDMIGAANPQRNQGRALTVREMLDRAADRVGDAFPGEAETQALVRAAIGRAYYELGLFDKAHEQQSAALRWQRRSLGTSDLATLKTTINYAANLYALGKFEEGRKLEQEALATLREQFGPDHCETLHATGNMAASLHALGKHAEAQQLFEKVLETKLRVLGAEDRSTMISMANLATNLHEQGKNAEAEKLHREVLKIERRILGPKHPSTLTTIGNLAVCLGNLGKLKEAEGLHLEVLKIRREVLGPEHPNTLATINNLAVNLSNQHRHTEARRLLRKLVTSFRKSLGDDHPTTLTTMHNLAMEFFEQADYAQASKELQQSLDIARRVLGPEHPTTLHIMKNLARCLMELRKPAEACELLREVVELLRRSQGAEEPATLAAMRDLAEARLANGENQRAREIYKEVLEIQTRSLGLEHAQTLKTMSQIAGSYMLEEQFAEAERAFSEVLDLASRTFGPDHVATVPIRFNLGVCLQKQGRIDEARTILEMALKIQRAVLGSEHPTTRQIEKTLATVSEF